MFDGSRLHQVFTNLLENAAQHGANREPITLAAHGESDRITVQVRNRGRAIPVDQLQVIFNPLVQIETKDDHASSSNLGLGLYIAREIVLMHGGTIGAESDAAGTVFSARLPRSRPEQRLAAPSP